MKLLLSPHDDDSVLFAAFTCLREKPRVVVVLDSYIQPNRGEKGCSAVERANETRLAHEVLGVETHRLGMRDDTATELGVLGRINDLGTWRDVDVVYAPIVQGGNRHHDWVATAAQKVFGAQVVGYTTYNRSELYTVGNREVTPNVWENYRKIKAMQCHMSQWHVNWPHFLAVMNKPEWLVD